MNGVAATVTAALQWTRAGGPAWRLGRHSIHRLGWYLVVGERGAGKSTMLRAVGQRPEDRSLHAASAADDTPVRGWFGNDAVLFEATIGDAADDEPWRALIGRLRHVRRGCPVNGVIVTVTAERLMESHNEARVRYAHALRVCIDECYRLWRRRVPVHVLVTQCDRLSGFDAFVGDLTDEARAAPLGMVFPLGRASLGDVWRAHLSQAFESLTREARAQVIARMPARSDVARAAMTLRFPDVLEALAAPLGEFLYEAFEASPGRPETLLLRSVHCSAALRKAPLLEEPTPRSVPSPEDAGRICFVDGFMREAVLRERDLARSRHAMPHRRIVASRMAAAACAVLVACAGAGLLLAYRQGADAVAATAPSASALVHAAETGIDLHSPRAMLALLDRARALPCGEAWQAPRGSWLIGLGFVREMRLEAACRAAYRTVLRETLQPYLVSRLTESLRDISESPATRFATLRAYLMLGERAHYDRDAVLAWFANDALHTALSSAERAAWVAHGEAWSDPAEFKWDVALDAKLIAAARARLLERPEAQRVFEAVMPVLREAIPEPLSVADMAGPGAALVFYRKSGARLSDGVPGPYTLAGMRRYAVLRDAAIAQSRRDGWVLDSPRADRREPQKLADDVDRLYFTAYEQAWDSILSDVALRPLPRSDDGAAFVALLAGYESPLRALFARAAKETTTANGEHEPSAAPTTLGASGVFNAIVQKVRRWFITGMPATRPRDRPPSGAALLVDRHFDALHRLVSGSGDDSASPLGRVQAQLKEVAVYLRAAGVARASGLPAPPDDALEQLAQSAAAVPPPLGDMLASLAQRGASTAQSEQRAMIDERWRTELGPFCHAATEGRYPMFAGGEDEVTLDDFTRLFAAGGLVDTFFQTYLKPYVDTSTVPWRWRPRVAPPGLSLDALREFERAAQIREAFFSGKGNTMDVRFALTPRSMDAELTRFVLVFGGQTLDYAHGPLQAKAFDWPVRVGERAARIDFSPAGADGRHGVEARGAWSLFRLLDEGRLDALAPDRFRLSFALDGHNVVLDLAASSVVNPFSLPALRAFRCPSGF